LVDDLLSEPLLGQGGLTLTLALVLTLHTAVIESKHSYSLRRENQAFGPR
jgi:hypothetical protein